MRVGNRAFPARFQASWWRRHSLYLPVDADKWMTCALYKAEIEILGWHKFN